MTERPPLVGITGRRIRIASLFPKDAVLLGDETAELHFSAFARHVAAAGGVPVPLAWDVDADAVMDAVDALVLSGGEDVDPAHSGAAAAFDPAPERDATELALIEVAARRGMPVLGVCRGMQLLAVAHGGTLNGAPTLHDRRDLPFRHRSHGVRTVPDTLAARLYGPSLEVNSVHRQLVTELPSQLIRSASADDGSLEALEDLPGRTFGVQWHPEFEPEPDPAFRWLVAAARAATGARQAA